MESKKLYRSSKDSVLAGVCGGIGEYFNIDPVIVRIVWIVVTFIGGAGILGYLIAWVIIPKEDSGPGQEKSSKGCLYAILIFFLACMATAVLGPIIRFVMNIFMTGASYMMPGWHYSYGSSVVLSVISLIFGGLVAIAVIALIIYFIVKAAKK